VASADNFGRVFQGYVQGLYVFPNHVGLFRVSRRNDQLVNIPTWRTLALLIDFGSDNLHRIPVPDL
jgi:hypothetical protein